MTNNETIVGRSGRFNVDVKFNTLVKPRIVYTVRGNNLITELLRENKNLYEISYKIAGLTKAEFDADVANDVHVLTLVDSANDTVYIPINRVIGGCIRDGVEYEEKVLILSLGGFPVSNDLLEYASKVVDVTIDSLGVIPKYEITTSSIIQMVSSQEHSTIMTTRGGNNTSISEELRIAKEALAKANKTISDLECIIKQKAIV